MKDTKSTFGKKFYDILFESEDEETEEIEETEEENIPEPYIRKEEKKDTPVSLNASDILHKKSAQSAFIDYVKSPVVQNNETSKETKEEEETYEFSSNISPIFGVIGPKKKEPAVNPDRKVVSSQTNRPEDYHLDIVPSPIYGYSSKEEAERDKFEVNNFESVDDEELHRLFETQDNLRIKDEEINLFDSFEEEE
ncbi:MAG: hypothetical protein Q4D13_08955 [Erysipelotrichaceae bacterium]|nr:hypothetical protein [Erysipelotrichaceae bacterium]